MRYRPVFDKGQPTRIGQMRHSQFSIRYGNRFDNNECFRVKSSELRTPVTSKTPGSLPRVRL